MSLKRLMTVLRKSIDRYTDREPIFVVSIIVLAMGVVTLVVFLLTLDGNYTLNGTALGSDYPQFYSAGTILNDGDATRLYDLELQQKHLENILTREDEGSLPYVYPPFFAVQFIPLARLPYVTSYLVWLGIIIGLFVVGNYLLRPSLPSFGIKEHRLVLVLALSFQPFLMECCLGGQTSPFAFFAFALALFFQARGKQLASGLALSICLYKPPLLLLILPFLCLGRQWKVLSGFLLGAAMLTVVSIAVIGESAFYEYLQLLWGYAEKTREGFRTWKYVDLTAFFRLLYHGHSAVSQLSSILLIATGLVLLLKPWLTCSQLSPRNRNLLWGCTITWTLVLNVYVCIYEVILVLIGVVFTAETFYARHREDAEARTDTESQSKKNALPIAFRTLLVLLYATPWLSQIFAKTVGLQLLTPVLIAVGLYQLKVFHKVTRPTT